MPEAPLVIINPVAGGGRAMRAVPWLRERVAALDDARLEITAGPGDAERIAADARRSGHDRVIAVGGDGTVQAVVNGLLSAGGGRVSLGIVPVGRGNDLARSLPLASDPAAAWRVAVGHATRPIDVGLAVSGTGAERWFASAGGIGFDAQVAAVMAERRGFGASRIGYLATTLAELRRFRTRSIRLALDGETITRRVLFVAIANGAYYGGGMRIAPAASPDDGRLDVCIVGDISRLTALRQMPNLYRGTHIQHPAVEMRTGAVVEAEGDDDVRVHLDGEPFGTLPIRISLNHHELDVAAP